MLREICAKLKETMYITNILKEIFNSGICDSWKWALTILPKRKDREKHAASVGREHVSVDLATSASSTHEQKYHLQASERAARPKDFDRVKI